MNISIREASLPDLPQLSILFSSYRMFYGKESELEPAAAFLEERILENDSKILVALNNGSFPCGFIQMYPVFSSLQMKRSWILNDLYVGPAFRAFGIGKQLIEEAKKLCVRTNADGISLQTAVDNTIGNQLYRSLGFELDLEFNYYFWKCNY